MDGFKESAITIVSLIVGIAALSIILSPKATTTGVLQAGASGLANTLGVAMSPVTGANVNINTAYPAGNGGYGQNLGSPNLAFGQLFGNS